MTTEEREGHRPATPAPGTGWVLSRAEFPKFLQALSHAGYRVVGPTIRDGAIVYGELRSESDLPIGWTDRQEAGQYRLERREDAALFGYNVGPHSWKKYLFPPRERLLIARQEGPSFRAELPPDESPQTAFLGVRACEVAAIRIQDKVFLGGRAVDPGYARRRQGSLVVAVQCGQAGATCFCVSMGTGPGVREGYDLALTEVLDAHRHEFLIEVGTPRGAEVLAEVPLRPAAPADVRAADERVARAARAMGRTMDTVGIRDLLLGHLDHAEWEQLGRRCLSCTNCTMACPTCFCSANEEVPDLNQETVERWRRWDSCFNLAYSEVHGGSVRTSPSSRYRQWMTHKLASWYDQFGSSGCVGCGRCITWCPVGIDITAEVATIRASLPPPAAAASKAAEAKAGGA